MAPINCKLAKNKNSKKCERKWTKTRDSKEQAVWVNPGLNRRVVVAKGAKAWQVWKEKNEGRVSSDKSFIGNGYLGSLLNRKEATLKAHKFMRGNK